MGTKHNIRTASDALILDAWKAYRHAIDCMSPTGDLRQTDTGHSPLFAAYTAAEVVIVNTEAVTIAGALAKAWVALAAIRKANADPQWEALAHRADFEGLERIEADLDWEYKAVFGLIRTLRRFASLPATATEANPVAAIFEAAQVTYEDVRQRERVAPDSDDKVQEEKREAVDQLIGTPAATYRQILTKLRAAQEQFDGFQMPDYVINEISDDLRRLAGEFA